MILFETDEGKFGGHQRINDAHNQWYKVYEAPYQNRPYSLKLYIPSRCAIVLVPFQFALKYSEVKMPHYDKADPRFSQFLPKDDGPQEQTKVHKQIE